MVPHLTYIEAKVFTVAVRALQDPTLCCFLTSSALSSVLTWLYLEYIKHPSMSRLGSLQWLLLLPGILLPPRIFHGQLSIGFPMAHLSLRSVPVGELVVL